MKQHHMYSLLDRTYTTVKVVFGNTIQPGVYDARIENVDLVEGRDGKVRMKTVMDIQAQGRGARVVQDRNPPAWASGERTWTYKVPKAWGVKEGDTLLVFARSDLKAANVVKVDIDPDIDVDADFTYQWAVQRVDFEYYNELVATERRFGESMLEVERIKQRESLLNSFRESLPEGSVARELFEQTTASLTPPAAPGAPCGGKTGSSDV